MIKSIDVNCKSFRNVNGNSYFAGWIVINFGLPDQKGIKIPYQYGYNGHYEYVAFNLLKKQGFIKTRKTIPWHYYKDNGIVYRCSMQTNCRKKDVLSFIS